ncbi:phage tail protein, partial [Escherichia coli]
MVAESGKKYRSDDTEAILKNLGLQETVNQASGALQKKQNGADIPG